eukprot:XP_017445968.1 PREDICTED: prostatic steroid-binding protein C1-like isoform X1 [Rattus norvegicus]
MRLSLCLQTILVVCCYEANANHVCEAVKHEIITFILKREEELKTELENYDAPLESIEAKLKVKRCVDQMSYEDRCRVSGALRNNKISRKDIHDLVTAAQAMCLPQAPLSSVLLCRERLKMAPTSGGRW